MTDMDVKTGKLRADGRAFALVVARFNDFVTSKLLEGAVDTLVRLGAAEGDITVAWVPGALEIPVTATALARSGRFAAGNGPWTGGQGGTAPGGEDARQGRRAKAGAPRGTAGP